MWTLLVLRLLLPWTPESSFSVFNILPLEKHEATNERSHIFEPIGTTTAGTSGNKTDTATAIQSTNSVLHNDNESAPYVNKSEEKPLSTIQILSLVWLIGSVSMLGCICMVNGRFAVKLNREPSIEDQTIRALFEQCKDEMKIKRTIALIDSSHVTSPTLYGAIMPKILLPRSVMGALSVSQLRYVFLHEMSHIKRNDIAMNWLMNILLTLHWFNPLLWYAYSKMRNDQEIACDSLALTRINPEETKEYALTIIRLLENFSNPIRLAGAASISSNKNELRRRVVMIASFNKNANKRSLLGLMVMLLISGCALTNAESNVNSQGVDTKPNETVSAKVEGSSGAEILAKANVEQYVNEHIGVTSQGGQLFTAYEILGSETKGQQIKYYLWVLCEERTESNPMKVTSGTSVPISITVDKDGNQYRITKHEMPRDGNLHGKDIRVIFPEEVQHKVYTEVKEHNMRVAKLETIIDQQARNYFMTNAESNNHPQGAEPNVLLSAKELEVYNLFQKDLNEQHLKELEPISIAKLYVQSQLDKKYDVTYALYTDREEFVQWTKEDDDKMPNTDRGSIEQVLKTFKGIESGEFVQTSDFRGYIEYQPNQESKSGFQMIKDDDGIWNVSFLPIQ